ncbi:MAG: hypothetical protein M3R00_03900, partial [Pseudomonadota bacterium]|nr:hypothetical protein [Pseudomonadota bacterium]
MKHFKANLAILTLVLLANSPLYASGNSSVHHERVLNDVTIRNESDNDIAYRIKSSMPDVTYGLKKGEHHKYHAKLGDDNVTIEIGICKHVVKGGFCTESVSMQNAVGG